MSIDQKTENRPLSVIARDIARDWKTVNYAARPYLDAMRGLDSVSEKYGFDSGRDIVARFLCNAGQWRGPVARAIKTELKTMAGIK